MNELIIAGGIAALVIAVISLGLVMVPQRRTMVIERLGRYHRTLEPGLNFIIPFVDQGRAINILRFRGTEPFITTERKIDMREIVLDFPRQSVITKDNVGVAIDGVLYYQIMDGQSAVYGTENLVLAIQTLAQTTLRSEIGKMELDAIFESREEINASLQITMDEAGNKWGVKVNRVEIRDIDIPNEIREAMNKQMVAERSRRAMVREAEGYKEAEIQRAEGDKQSAILNAQGDRDADVARAEGERQAFILTAEGEAQAIRTIMDAIVDKTDPQQAINYLIAQRYISMLPNLAKDGDRVFVPMEGTALLSSVGGMRDLFAPAAVGAMDQGSGGPQSS
ncbi:regulator of protease activity HflC (stomatin/prohibitin superfamily) [Natronocella acetinitrilica]|uniref:Regulator of protease activity HflC (Stomatin/prohibitin superfamily) n=1 Tax=Natronocella acetinitrilica TaxID=414046 RepID=A0AAE3G3H1_9GAMM|nr:SPFH domain-containing protein [Natronocella acetinitrilica]MCP1673227.1 regulator of protease activity HflC (stomatin/prohibitin superfamily) [Natronocella acetinitrilica]